MHHVRSGDGPPLLLVHGIGMSHRAFAPKVTEPLADGFTTYAVDLPGFGESPALAGAPMLRALADACAAFMAEQGHERFHVAGNSLGGGVALHLALDGRALSACALSPIGFADGWERLYLQVMLRQTYAGRSLLAASAPFAATRRAAGYLVADHGERLTPDEFRAGAEDLKNARAFLATSRFAIQWRCPGVASLPCPVTVAWAEHDRLLLYGPQSARARERLPSAQHVTLPAVGHVPSWDDPALVARTIRAACG